MKEHASITGIRRSNAKHKLDRWIDQYIEASVDTVPVVCRGKNHLVAQYDRGGYTYCGSFVPPTEPSIPLTLDALKERNERGLVCLKCAKQVVI